MPKPNPTKRRELGAIVDAPEKWRDLIGQRFGRLEVIGYTGRSRRPGDKLFACRCDCTWFIDVNAHRLRSGNTTSCGCAHSDFVAARNIADSTHGHARGGKVTPEYRAWQAMINRCHRPKDVRFKDYGARGIMVCPRWRTSFQAFLDDMGQRPSRLMSLERLNNNGDYEPGNTGWASSTDQNRNQRTTKLYEHAGESLPLGEWAERAGMPYEVIYSRVVRFNWPLSLAMARPVGGGGRYSTGNEPEYQRLRGVWSAMITRCYDVGHVRYARYGGRQIGVCERWLASYDDYFDDIMQILGPRPSPQHTLDRVENDLGYEPSNMRWATSIEQIRNRSITRLYELDDEHRPLAEWCELAGMPFRIVQSRVLTYGWPLDEALGTPVGGHGRTAKEDRRKWRRTD